MINQDQIAVLAALEVAYEANKNVQKNSTDAQRSAAEKGRRDCPSQGPHSGT